MHIRRQSENHIRRPHRHDSQLLGCSCLTLQRCVCMQFGCCPRNSCAGQTCCVTVLTRRPHRSRRNLAALPTPRPMKFGVCQSGNRWTTWRPPPHPRAPSLARGMTLQSLPGSFHLRNQSGRESRSSRRPGGAPTLEAPMRPSARYSWHQVGTCAGGTVILLSRQVPPQRPTDGAHGSCPANFLARWRNCTHLQTQMRNT